MITPEQGGHDQQDEPLAEDEVAPAEAESEEDSYGDAIALFSFLAEEHLTQNMVPIARMWDALLDFLYDTEVPFDPVRIDAYPGVRVIPSLELVLAQERQEQFYMMDSEVDDLPQGTLPPFIVIMNGEEEILVYSRVVGDELFSLSPAELTHSKDWQTEASLKQAVARLVTAKFEEYNFYSRHYQTVTADDLPRGIKKFLLKTIDKKKLS